MIYLDHAATTPLRDEARDAWLEAQRTIGNASSVHGAGQNARRVLEEARERFAKTLGAEPIEVVFTSGGTESVGLALQGMWRRRQPAQTRIVLPDGEHHATLDTVAWLASREGAEVSRVGLDDAGRIPIDAFGAALDDAAMATALVAGNETGTVNDAAGLANAAARVGVPLHLDAVAALGHMRVDFGAWRGDAPAGLGLVGMSVSGHKIGAPVGTGALVVSRTASIEPVLHGGGQQRGIRAGTQDIAGAVALATAAEIAEAERLSESARLEALRERLVADVGQRIPAAIVLGDRDRHLPGTVHVMLPGAAGESVLFLLDQRGISVSTGSACQAGVAEPSHVVMALGYTAHQAREVVRISMGRGTTAPDIDALADGLVDAYERIAGG